MCCTITIIRYIGFISTKRFPKLVSQSSPKWFQPMNYRIAQNPDLPEVSEMERPLSSVNPLETFGNQSKPTIETEVSYSKLSGLSFPASYTKVAESLTKLGFKVNVNTLKGRWVEKYIEPALEGVDCPLWKENGITEFGFNAIAEILQRCVFAGAESIAPETLRNDLIERYGRIDTPIDLLDLVAESARQKELERTENSSALVKQSQTDTDRLNKAIEANQILNKPVQKEDSAKLSAKTQIDLIVKAQSLRMQKVSFLRSEGFTDDEIEEVIGRPIG